MSEINNRAMHDLRLAREIEQALPAFKRIVSDLLRANAVVGQDLEDLRDAIVMLKTAAGRLTLRANSTLALDCEGSDPIADAERTWPEG